MSNICATGSTTLTPYCLHILIGVMKENEANGGFIPIHDEIWWLKVFNNCIRVEDKDKFVRLLKMCKVYKLWSI